MAEKEAVTKTKTKGTIKKIIMRRENKKKKINLRKPNRREVGGSPGWSWDSGLRPKGGVSLGIT